MKVLKSDEVNEKSNGTYYIDWTTTSYFNLISLFGLPTYEKRSVDNKVLSEWIIEGDDGAIATIYDYKSGEWDVEFVTCWHLGGNEDSYWLINQIKEKVNKSVDAHNLVC